MSLEFIRLQIAVALNRLLYKSLSIPNSIKSFSFLPQPTLYSRNDSLPFFSHCTSCCKSLRCFLPFYYFKDHILSIDFIFQLLFSTLLSSSLLTTFYSSAYYLCLHRFSFFLCIIYLLSFLPRVFILHYFLHFAPYHVLSPLYFICSLPRIPFLLPVVPLLSYFYLPPHGSLSICGINLSTSLLCSALLCSALLSSSC